MVCRYAEKLKTTLLPVNGGTYNSFSFFFLNFILGTLNRMNRQPPQYSSTKRNVLRLILVRAGLQCLRLLQQPVRCWRCGSKVDEGVQEHNAHGHFQCCSNLLASFFPLTMMIRGYWGIKLYLSIKHEYYRYVFFHSVVLLNLSNSMVLIKVAGIRLIFQNTKYVSPWYKGTSIHFSY